MCEYQPAIAYSSIHTGCLGEKTNTQRRAISSGGRGNQLPSQAQRKRKIAMYDITTQPEKIRGLRGHSTVGTNDLDAATAFYDKLLAVFGIGHVLV
ncbi:hypothetical protein N181_03675 [Sinorhizobium fredii USDA 205]|nr:hypothetical protein N181_03675 [Sinorhizobium fredii USDA 205]